MEAGLTGCAEVLKTALDEGLPDMALKNCHAFGMDSIVLRRTIAYGEKTSMVRMFVAWHDVHFLDQLYQDDGHYTLGVHNHRYDLMLQPLVGTLTNYECELDAPSDTRLRRYKFPFVSGIGGTMKLGTPDERSLRSSRAVDLPPGSVRLMAAPEWHTVIVKKDPALPFTAWMVFEGADYNESKLVSPLRNPPLRDENLYLPMSPPRAYDIVEQVLGLMKTG